MNQATSPTVPGRWLALLLVLALALRLWGIRYGLPWLFYFHDEPQIVLRALRFGTGDPNPHFFIWPATLLLYLAFAGYGLYFVAGYAAGWWKGAQGFAEAYFSDPSPFYLIARAYSVGFGVASVWLSYGLGRAAYSVPVGLAAAAGIALNAVHGHYSHFAHPVTGMCAMTWAGLWLAWRVAAGDAPRVLMLAGVVMGVGVSIQYHTAVLVAPILAAAAYRAREGEAVRWLRHGVLACALGLLTFLVICPYAVLDFRTFAQDLAWISAKTAGTPAGGALGNLALFWGIALGPTLTFPLTVATLIGLGYAAVKRTRADVLLIVFSFAYILLASRAGTMNDRYGLPLLLPALLLAARAIEVALRRVPPLAVRATAAVPVVIVALMATSVIDLVETDHSMTQADTREASLSWFEANVPDGSSVVIDMARFWNSRSTPLAGNRRYFQERIDEVERGVEGAGHGAAYLDYFRFQLRNLRRPSYYLRSTLMGDDIAPLDALRAKGFCWAVVSDDAVTYQRARAVRGDSTGLHYYAALEREAELEAEFRAGRWERRGPTIRIYRLCPAPGP